ncbi:hypothetical protein SEA_MISCHIEF19_50 [Streptomyces phage Mischief19]|nr:hypothetical protein SEA_MISCHIEF19_50 [Streptomyces phage Mischief19]
MSDSNIRIEGLPSWHAERNIPYQADGMSDSYLAVICRGADVSAVVNYVRRDKVGSVHEVASLRERGSVHALGALNNRFGEPVPFFTAVYDWKNYAAQVCAHNEAARRIVAEVTGGYDDAAMFLPMTEAQFKAVLHVAQGHPLSEIYMHPAIYGSPWRDVSADDMRAELTELRGRGRLKHPQQRISNRVASYGRMRHPQSADYGLPQFDLDLVVSRREANYTQRVSLLVEYKSANSEFTMRGGKVVPTNGSNHTYSAERLTNLRTAEGYEIPALIARYRDLADEGEPITLYPLNRLAWSHVAFCLGHYGNEVEQTSTLATAVEGLRPVHVSQAMWEQIIKDAAGR